MNDFKLFWGSLNKKQRKQARQAMLAEAEKTMAPRVARLVVDMAIANARKGVLNGNPQNVNTQRSA